MVFVCRVENGLGRLDQPRITIEKHEEDKCVLERH